MKSLLWSSVEKLWNNSASAFRALYHRIAITIILLRDIFRHTLSQSGDNTAVVYVTGKRGKLKI